MYNAFNDRGYGNDIIISVRARLGIRDIPIKILHNMIDRRSVSLFYHLSRTGPILAITSSNLKRSKLRIRGRGFNVVIITALSVYVRLDSENRIICPQQL